MSYQNEEVQDEHSRQALAPVRIPGIAPRASGHVNSVHSVTLIVEGGQARRRKRRAYDDEGELRWNPETRKLEQA